MVRTNRAGWVFEAPKSNWEILTSSAFAALLAGVAAGFAIGLVEVLS